MAIDMSGEALLPAEKAVVWEMLNDPEVLQACIPGCEELERTSDNGFAAVARVKIGPVKARFKGAVTLEDMDPPNGYRIVGSGEGGVAGFAEGGATVRLEEAEGGTLLKYEASAKVGGKLAQIGNRLVGGVAKKMADQFFANFEEAVKARG
ncbi:CoxG family protein [Antarctobacter sp.]|uniref:CoxG family protein n=1 Tax=Antarctobacter sp. TaxID=1872577 RepID=UPI003A8D1CA4